MNRGYEGSLGDLRGSYVSCRHMCIEACRERFKIVLGRMRSHVVMDGQPTHQPNSTSSLLSGPDDWLGPTSLVISCLVQSSVKSRRQAIRGLREVSLECLLDLSYCCRDWIVPALAVLQDSYLCKQYYRSLRIEIGEELTWTGFGECLPWDRPYYKSYISPDRASRVWESALSEG